MPASAPKRRPGSDDCAPSDEPLATEQKRKVMALSFELYWSFRSPYSYIALPRVMLLTRDFAVEVEMRVVHPAAIRNPAYFRAMNPLARPYTTSLRT